MARHEGLTRLWYARRGIPWIPFLTCLLVALVGAAGAQQWPRIAGALLIASLAGCAAAPGFVFDEPAGSAVWVTPRGERWAHLTRGLVALLPALLWCSVLATLAEPGDFDRSRWLTMGLGSQVLALGLAWAASRRGVAVPGNTVAPAVVGLTLVPFVIGPMIGWTPL
jgi:hypothetical protein